MTKEEAVAKALKKALDVKIICRDIYKGISVKKDGCLLCFDVIHREELDITVLHRCLTAVYDAYKAVKALGYKTNYRGDIMLQGVDGNKLYNILLRECQEQNKKVWDELGTAEEFNLFKEV